MRFEWDDEKNRINKQKHGISFETAVRVWDDTNHFILPDLFAVDEERWIAIGDIGFMTVVVAVHTYRDRHHGEAIRIISARKATNSERRRYEQEVFG